MSLAANALRNSLAATEAVAAAVGTSRSLRLGSLKIRFYGSETER
jgi:hypothetical protein